jgi:hypothetical protein
MKKLVGKKGLQVIVKPNFRRNSQERISNQEMLYSSNGQPGNIMQTAVRTSQKFNSAYKGKSYRLVHNSADRSQQSKQFLVNIYTANSNLGGEAGRNAIQSNNNIQVNTLN